MFGCYLAVNNSMGVVGLLLLPFPDGVGFQSTECGNVKRLTGGGGTCRYSFKMHIMLLSIALDRICVMSLEFIQDEDTIMRIEVGSDNSSDVIEYDISIGPT